MNTNIEVLRELDELVEAARLLGATQAKKLFGEHTEGDRRFERAMYESIDKHRAALLDWAAKQPALRAEDEPDLVKCAECGAELIPVRPGKWQHPDCSQSSWAAESVKVIDDLAHEIWAAAQTAPGEGIVDAVDRIAAILARYGQSAPQPTEPEK